MNLDNIWSFVLGMGTMYTIVLWLSRNDKPMPKEIKESTAEIWIHPEPKTNPHNRTQLIAGITVKQMCRLASYIQSGKPLTYRAIKKATGISGTKWDAARKSLVGRGKATYGARDTLVLVPGWQDWIIEQLAPAPQEVENRIVIPPDKRTDNRQSSQSPAGGWKPIKKGWRP